MSRLDDLDQTERFETKKDYEKQLEKLQLQLLEIQSRLRTSKRSVVIGYEGSDAAGKGGSIKRVVQRLDPRGYHVWPIGAPTPEELDHHYLWRFWTKLPGSGRISIFDRTWYGRVLVERVEKLTPKEDWQRSYTEINEFEKMLTDSGVVLVKFWIQITKDEQLKRFKEREDSEFKKWKITPDDWRNREKWGDYQKAAGEMFDRCDTPWAPWHLIAGNYKWWARVQTLKAIVDACRDIH